MEKKIIMIDFSELAEEYPPMFARSEVDKLFGGVISTKTLANLDSLGKGPKRMRIGRKVVYLRDDFLNWLEKRTKYLN
jgi:hypothetical protein